MQPSRIYSRRRPIAQWLSVCLITFGLIAEQAFAVRYVSTTGSDAANDCSNNASPCVTVQRAVDEAVAAEEVRVAAGTYSGSEVRIVNRLGTDHEYKQVVFIDKALTLNGGYLEADWNTANPEANPTIIDALGDGRAVTIVDTGNDPVTIRGFTLTGGDYTGLGNPLGEVNHVCRASAENDCGGGLYVYQSAFHLADCVISENVASTNAGDGGGIYLWSARESTIERTMIIGNSAPLAGGGLYMTSQRSPFMIRNTVFDQNAAHTGGGVRLSSNIHNLVRFEDSVLTGNTAEGSDGGGLYANLTDAGLLLELDRVVVENNTAWGQGAGIFLTAAGPDTPAARLLNVLFTGNDRVNGAPVATEDAVLAVASNFTSLEATLTHVTAADNPAPTFVYARPDTDPGRTLLVTGENVLLSGFQNGWAAEESGTGEATIEVTNTLLHNVTNEFLTVDGTPDFTATNTLTGDPMLDAVYRLQAGSAAIDSGVGAGVHEDIDGEYRPQGEGPDIGADEYFLGRILIDGFELE